MLDEKPETPSSNKPRILALNTNEKKYWHLYECVVKSGLLVQVSMGLVLEVVAKATELTLL